MVCLSRSFYRLVHDTNFYFFMRRLTRPLTNKFGRGEKILGTVDLLARCIFPPTECTIMYLGFGQLGNLGDADLLLRFDALPPESLRLLGLVETVRNNLILITML
ncbi:hypothetical protein EBT25_07040 [bacterium]|nr:hypothetical protein [bacterium]